MCGGGEWERRCGAGLNAASVVTSVAFHISSVWLFLAIFDIQTAPSFLNNPLKKVPPTLLQSPKMTIVPNKLNLKPNF